MEERHPTGSVCLTKLPNFYSVEKGREEGVADPMLDISTPPGSVRTRPMSGQEGAHRYQLHGQLYQVRATITALCPNGSPLGDPGPLGDLFGDLGPLWVPFFSILD